MRRVEDITEALWGQRVSPSTVSELNQKIYATIEEWRQRPIEGEYAYVYMDGIWLKRSWGGEVRNIAVLVPSSSISTFIAGNWAIRSSRWMTLRWQRTKLGILPPSAGLVAYCVLQKLEYRQPEPSPVLTLRFCWNLSSSGLSQRS